jgi:hypothetical protein
MILLGLFTSRQLQRLIYVRVLVSSGYNVCVHFSPPRHIETVHFNSIFAKVFKDRAMLASRSDSLLNAGSAQLILLLPI